MLRKKSSTVKIAIPSDDGILVGQKFKSSRAFVVATIDNGEILRQELRWNLISEIMTSPHGYYYNLTDCDAVIVNEIGDGHTKLLGSINKEVFLTEESLVNNAFRVYLKEISMKAEKIKSL
jgi:predicted Fe-Mo cluster-binding NifX family protein